MQAKINNIRIDDLFWIHFHENFISFSLKGVQEDVHFTISYHENSNDINFHVTRNIGSNDAKPRIEILRISKLVLEQIGPYSLINLLHKFLKPVDVLPYLQGNDTPFLSIESMEAENSKDLENILIDAFKPFTKIKKKTRIKVSGPIEERFEEMCTSDEYIDRISDRIISFKDAMNSGSRGGILYFNDQTIALIKYEGRWYEYDKDIALVEIVESVVDEFWANAIIKQTKRALVRIRKAKTYQETLVWNNPIILVVNPAFEKMNKL